MIQNLPRLCRAMVRIRLLDPKHKIWAHLAQQLMQHRRLRRHRLRLLQRLLHLHPPAIIRRWRFPVSRHRPLHPAAPYQRVSDLLIGPNNGEELVVCNGGRKLLFQLARRVDFLPPLGADFGRRTRREFLLVVGGVGFVFACFFVGVVMEKIF